MTYSIVNADNRHVLAAMPENSVDAVVTDPPYGMSREPDMIEVLRHWLAGDDYQHSGGGFMGKSWDSFVPGPVTWRHVLRVLKPGGHLLAFFAPRTYDLGVLAIRLAGFEIRDQIEWMFGTGFPKSKNVAMSIDKGEGVIGHRSVRFVAAGGDLPPPDRSVGAYVPEGDTPGAPWSGWGTALKPAHEPIVLARKPLIGTVAANVLAHGTGGLNIDACRIGSEGGTVDRPDGCGTRTNEVYGTYGSCQTVRPTGLGRWPANVLLDEWLDPVLCLSYNAPEPVREYYADHEGVRGVRVPDDDPAEPRTAQAFLLSGLLRDCAVAPAAGGAPDAGAQAFAGIAGAHAVVESSEPAEGIGIASVEGWSAPQSGLRDRGGVEPARARTSSVRINGEPEQQSMHPGAPAGDGAQPWSAALVGGIGASPQRDQARQPDRESGAARQRDAQARTSGDRSRTESRAGGDRTIEIRASEVPVPWLKYFRRTGEAIRCGSAAMLDAQSGTSGSASGRVTKSGARAPRDNPVYGVPNTSRNAPDDYGDSGGASRFFYTAKASKAEREAGLEHLPVRSDGELTDRVDGSDGLNSPRAGAGRGGGRRNHHPTVKPIALMRYLCRLITPPGGVVLDPFAGSGSTIVAAVLEGFNAIGIDLDPEYCNIARARVAHWETK